MSPSPQPHLLEIECIEAGLRAELFEGLLPPQAGVHLQPWGRFGSVQGLHQALHLHASLLQACSKQRAREVWTQPGTLGAAPCSPGWGRRRE